MGGVSTKYGFENYMLKTVHMPEMRLLRQQSMLKQSTQRPNRTLKESKLSGPMSLVPLVNKRMLRISDGASFYSFPDSAPSLLARGFHKTPKPDARGGGSRRMVRRRSTRRQWKNNRNNQDKTHCKNPNSI